MENALPGGAAAVRRTALPSGKAFLQRAPVRIRLSAEPGRIKNTGF